MFANAKRFVPEALKRVASRWSMRRRLAALFGIVLGIASVVLLTMLPARMNQQARTSLERRITTLSLLLAGSAAPGVAFEQAADVTRALEGLAAADDAVYAVVRAGAATVGGWHA